MRPKRGDIVTLTHVHERTSYGTALQIQSIKVEGDQIILTAKINAGPKELAGIDARLDNQKTTIDRLLAHLKEHCPRMTSGGQCEHME